MSDKDSHPIRNGLVITVIGGILLSFWPPFKDFLITSLSWSWGVIKSIGFWLSGTHEFYGWLFLLLLLLSIPSMFGAALFVFKKKQPSLEEIYTSDFLFGASWHWSYLNGSIRNLWCLCTVCKNELIYSEFRPDRFKYRHDGLEAKTDFICERCNITCCTLKGDREYALGIVEREIRRKIRNNEWQRSEE